MEEYALPAGANISQVHTLHRHGARYPTSGSNTQTFGYDIANATAAGHVFTGELAFLNTWTYKMGAEILVPVGRQQLFDSGVLHYYQYGQLYNTSTKIIARTTSEDRMLKSAENFLSGFFGLDWPRNATLEVIRETDDFTTNNTLAGYDNCNNSNLAVSSGGTNASDIWIATYLANATARFNSLAGGFNFTVNDTYAAQTMCPYETQAFGYSPFCQLFTYEEWQGFEYSIDLNFLGDDSFLSPTGRAVGVGYVEEILARLQGHLITDATAQINTTLDGSNTTFPLNQTLYFDFSHDTNIASILTAFGLTQFADVLPTDHIPANQQMIVSHLEPFGARLNIEIITTPQPVSASRANGSTTYEAGDPTTYVHFIQNQRTIPLGKSIAACGARDDGWCELGTFADYESNALAQSRYDFACNGDYPVVPYGGVTNGAPIQAE